MNRIFKVSRRIARVGGITLSAVAMFPRDKPVINRKVNRINPTLNEESIYIDFPGFLFLELPHRYSELNYGGYMAITPLGKVDFLILLDKMIHIFRNEKIFFESSPGHIGIYTVRDDNGNVSNPWIVRGKVGDVPIILEPIVVYDNTNEVEYEGVRFTIRNLNTYHDITFTDLLTLRSIVTESNIFVYTHLLLQTVGLATTARSSKEQEEFQEVQHKLDILSEVATLENRLKKIGGGTNVISSSQNGDTPSSISSEDRT